MTPEYFEKLAEAARRSMSGHTADPPGVYSADKPRTDEERAMADGVLTGFLLVGRMWCESMYEPEVWKLKEGADLKGNGPVIDAVSSNNTLDNITFT